MLLFGKLIDWIALSAVIASTMLYLAASAVRSGKDRDRMARAGRVAFILSALSILGSVATLGNLLITHQFQSDYVYTHSARAMDALYWFPSMWAGQEGSFLLWAFWAALAGVVLSVTSRGVESRVMPIHNSILIFLGSMLVVRSPFLPLDTHGGPIPTEGLGLNPNLENPWMVIHPPTLFLGIAVLGVPFAYALMALAWRDWTGWLRRALPWGLFGFSVLGLAMMMGGYWAYEMLGWGGFWGWDPVENGPLIPWLCTLAFIHAARVQRTRKALVGTTLTFAMLPFVTSMYETFLTRSGILEKFSVHSFSTLGGVGNQILLYVLLGSFGVMLAALIWRGRALRANDGVLTLAGTKNFGYLISVVLFSLCAAICTVGMSAPLLTTLGQKLHLIADVATVNEDYYNRATFPIAILLAYGMGMSQLISMKGEVHIKRAMLFAASAIAAAAAFYAVSRWLGSAVSGFRLVAEIVLFTMSIFALITNGFVLLNRLKAKASLDSAPIPEASSPIWMRLAKAGGFVSHIGAAVLLIGIVCLVTFVHREPSILLAQGEPESVLGGAYSVTYLGQTSNFETDKKNKLKFAVVSRDGRDKFTALLPFALRDVAGGDKQIFGHPAISHHVWGDLYLALLDGPIDLYRSTVYKPTISLGSVVHVANYDLQFVRFVRDPAAAAYVQSTGQLPASFPLTAEIRVTYHGSTSMVRPVFILHSANPALPDTPEAKLPGGWLVTFQGMHTGDDGASAASMPQSGDFTLRADTGPPVEAFDLQITTRPMINLVWIGTMLLVLGGLLSMTRQIIENRQTKETDPDSADKPARHSERKPHTPSAHPISPRKGKELAHGGRRR